MNGKYIKIENIVSRIMFFMMYVASFLFAKTVYAATSVTQTSQNILNVINAMEWSTENCDINNWTPDSCTLCPMFKAFLDAGSQVAQIAYDKLHAGVAAMVLIGTATWIAVYLIKQLSQFSTVEPMRMIQDIGRQLFRSMIIVLILNYSYSEVRSLTIDPVVETGMNITASFMDDSDCSNIGYSVSGKGGLSPNVGNKMLCIEYQVEKETSVIISLGKLIRCLAFEPSVGTDLELFVLPNLYYSVTGWLLWIVGGFLFIGCPYLLVDCVINLAYALAVLPVGVGCYAFKVTEKYLKPIWNTFLTAIFNFLFLVLVIYVIKDALNIIMTEMATSVKNSNLHGIEMICSLDALGFLGINCLKIVFILFLMWTSLQEVKSLAEKFSGGGLSPAKGIGADLGQQAAHAGTRMAKTSFGKGMIIGKAAHGRISHARGQLKSQFRGSLAMNRGAGVAGSELRDAAGNVRRDSNGNVMYSQYTRTHRRFGFIGRKVTDTVTVDAQGNQVSMIRDKRLNGLERWWKGMKNDVGVVSRTETNSLGTVSSLVSASGSIMAQDVKISDYDMNELLNSRGDFVDSATLVSKLSASGLSREKGMQMAQMALINKRFNSSEIKANTGTGFKAFISRDQGEFLTDASGNEIFRTTQINSDGTRTTFDMQLGGRSAAITITNYERDGSMSAEFRHNGVRTKTTRIDSSGRAHVSNGVAPGHQDHFFEDGTHLNKYFTDAERDFGMGDSRPVDFSKAKNRKNMAMYN